MEDQRKVGKPDLKETDDSASKWVIVIIAVAFEAVTLGDTYLSFPILSDHLIREFHASRVAVISCISLLIAVGAMTAPLVGRMVDLLAARVVICAGIVLGSAGLLVTAISRDLWLVQLVWATLIPAGTMMTGPLVGQALVSRRFDDQVGLAVGLTLAGVGLGGAIMPPIVNQLVIEYGWRNALSIAAAFNVILLLPPVWFLVKEPLQASSRYPIVSGHGVPAGVSGHGRLYRPAEILRTWICWLLIVAFIPFFIVALALQHNFGEICKDARLSTTAISYVVACFGGAMGMGKIAFGYASDVLPNRILYWTAVMLFLIAIYILTISTNQMMIMAGAAILGFAFGSYFPLLGGHLLMHFGARNIGTALGIISFFGALSSLGPLTISAVRDATGSYRDGYILMAFLIMIGGVAFFLLPDHAIDEVSED